MTDYGYREPFTGYYVRLTCNQQLVHENKVTAVALSSDKELKQDTLLYICPVCTMQHESLMEG